MAFNYVFNLCFIFVIIQHQTSRKKEKRKNKNLKNVVEKVAFDRVRSWGGKEGRKRREDPLESLSAFNNCYVGSVEVLNT